MCTLAFTALYRYVPDTSDETIIIFLIARTLDPVHLLVIQSFEGDLQHCPWLWFVVVKCDT